MDYDDRPGPCPAQPPTARWQQRAAKARFVLLGFYVVLSVGWYFVFLSKTDPLRLGFDGNASGAFLAGTLVLFGGQFLLLLGAPQLTWPRPRRKRSIFISLAAGSAIALLLSAGIICAGVSLYKLIYDPASFHGNWSISPASPTTAPAVAATPSDSGSDIPWMLIGVALVGWTFWFLIFALVGTGQWTRRFRWMYRILIAGTILELLITIPIDAEVRKRTSCYCGEGTFLSLVVGLTAILWMFGPGLAILFLIRRKQLTAGSGYCLKCSYDLHGLESARCPECGTPFKALAIR
jgi:hypothetical protein